MPGWVPSLGDSIIKNPCEKAATRWNFRCRGGTRSPSGFSHLLHFASVKGGAGASSPQPAWLSQLPTPCILRVPASPFLPSSPPHLQGQINCLKSRFDLILALFCIFSGSLYWLLPSITFPFPRERSLSQSGGSVGLSPLWL